MKIHLTALLLGLAAVLSPATRAASPGLVLAPDAYSVTLAAKSPGAGDSLRSDPGTFGEFFATNDRPYNPIVTSTLPAGWTSAQVWVRQRGGPFQLKGNGGASELQWNWSSPPTWTWVDYGTYTREQLTEKFLFIRSDTLAPDAGIDAVVLIRDEARPTSADLDLVTKQAAADLKKK